MTKAKSGNATSVDFGPRAAICLFAVILAAAAIVGTSGCDGGRTGPNPEDEAGVRDPLTYVNLQPLTGQSGPIGPADLQGHVVLLNIWGWWCPHCREELPHIAELRQRFAGQTAFRLVVVSYGAGDSPSDVESLREQTADLLKQLDVDLPTYYDTEGKTLDAIKAVTDFAGFPTTLLLDRHGVIRAIWSGYEAGVETEMERYIAMVLAEEGGKG
jgi:thiol-disulfide isomerase/thioredoxin